MGRGEPDSPTPDLSWGGVPDVEQLATQREDAIVVAANDGQAGHGQCLVGKSPGGAREGWFHVRHATGRRDGLEWGSEAVRGHAGVAGTMRRRDAPHSRRETTWGEARPRQDGPFPPWHAVAHTLAESPSVKISVHLPASFPPALYACGVCPHPPKEVDDLCMSSIRAYASASWTSHGTSLASGWSLRSRAPKPLELRS